MDFDRVARRETGEATREAAFPCGSRCVRLSVYYHERRNSGGVADNSASWRRLVRFVGPPAQLWHKAVQHLGPCGAPVYRRGRDEHSAEGAHRASLRRCHWWLGQPARRHSGRLLHSSAPEGVRAKVLNCHLYNSIPVLHWQIVKRIASVIQ